MIKVTGGITLMCFILHILRMARLSSSNSNTIHQRYQLTTLAGPRSVLVVFFCLSHISCLQLTIPEPQSRLSTKVNRCGS